MKIDPRFREDRVVKTRAEERAEQLRGLIESLSKEIARGECSPSAIDFAERRRDKLEAELAALVGEARS